MLVSREHSNALPDDVDHKFGVPNDVTTYGGAGLHNNAFL